MLTAGTGQRFDYRKIMAFGDSIDIAGNRDKVLFLSEGPKTEECHQRRDAHQDVESA